MTEKRKKMKSSVHHLRSQTIWLWDRPAVKNPESGRKMAFRYGISRDDVLKLVEKMEQL